MSILTNTTGDLTAGDLNVADLTAGDILDYLHNQGYSIQLQSYYYRGARVGYYLSVKGNGTNISIVRSTPGEALIGAIEMIEAEH